jgi:hypothetical protein
MNNFGTTMMNNWYNFKFLIQHLSFLFWIFLHIINKYNKIIRYLTSFMLSFFYLLIIVNVIFLDRAWVQI